MPGSMTGGVDEFQVTEAADREGAPIRAIAQGERALGTGVRASDLPTASGIVEAHHSEVVANGERSSVRAEIHHQRPVTVAVQLADRGRAAELRREQVPPRLPRVAHALTGDCEQHRAVELGLDQRLRAEALSISKRGLVAGMRALA